MIPIRDSNRSRNFPVANTLIIATNVLLFLVQLLQGPGLNRFIYTYGLVPARYSVPEIAAYFSAWQQIIALFSFMFLHAGFWHLLGNMWFLYIFGDNVEDHLGPVRYLAFYLLCGWVSGLSQLLTNFHSRIPTIGASGAISGVMGAYLILFPSSRVLTLIPIFFIPYFVEIPAFLFLGFWFLLQFISAAALGGQVGGIAWWAHIGGFVFGMILVKLLARTPQLGMTRRLRAATSRAKTPRLQVIRTYSAADDWDVYGDIVVTRNEAEFGTRKLVSIRSGIHSRMLHLNIPSGVREKTRLRLAGMGKPISEWERGDLFLTVQVRE